MRRKESASSGGRFIETLESRQLFTAVPLGGEAVPLTGVKPGDTITVQATITTNNDENEDGEGESLVISSSGGFSATDGSFNITRAYSFPATVSDETVSASIPNGDGDEDGSVDVSYSSAPNNKYTPAQKQAYAKLSADLAIAAAGAGTVAGGLGFALPPYSTVVAAGTWVGAGALGVAAAYYNRLSLDPPDSNFKIIDHPAAPKSASLVHANAFKGIKNASPLAAAINAINVNEQKCINLATAAYITANRVDGAAAVSNIRWENRQLAVLKSYKKQEAKLLAAQPKLLASEAKQFTKANIGTTAITSSDVQSFEQNVLNNGLPAGMVTALDSMGVDQATQDEIRQLLFVQDTSAATGTYQQIVSNSTILADIAEAVATLKKG